MQCQNLKISILESLSQSLMFQKIFTKLNISPVLFEKILTSVWLVFYFGNRFSKCKFSFPQKHADLYRVVCLILMIISNMLTQKYRFC